MMTYMLTKIKTVISADLFLKMS